MLLEAFFLKTGTELLKSLIGRLSQIRKERKTEFDELEKDFGPVKYLVPYYVIPHAQNVNPADFPEDDTGLVARNNVFDLLDKFLAGAPRFSHAFVLSDAGMGKTSLLVMIKLIHLNKFIKPDFEVVVLKIGPRTIDQIGELERPQETVLLLDALDEDSEAWQHFYTRLQMLLLATKMFRKVIITCRTQFFPKEHEEDGRAPGQVILSGFHCSKIFLSPFNDDQVEKYLHKKFDDVDQINKARKLIQQMHSLKFRPMLLSYIDFLIDHEQHYNNTYSIYEGLVEEWLNREMRKGLVEEKRLLHEACQVLAMHMYKNKIEAVPSEEVLFLCKSIEGVRNLQYMTIEGRSLLHRTSEGGYKFAHYSILEFFVATRLSSNPQTIPNSDQIISFIADMLSFKNLKKASGLDLTGITLPSANIDSVTFNGSLLLEAHFEDSSLKNSVFKKADLSGANFTNCSLKSANLKDAICKGTEFRKADLSDAILEDIDFSGCAMQNAYLRRSRIENSVFASANLESAHLLDINAAGINFDGANLANSLWRNTAIQSISLVGASLANANIQDSHLIDGRFQKSNLDSSHIVGTSLNESVFDGCSLNSAEWVDTGLVKASLKSVTAVGSTFKNIDGSSTSFSKSDLKNCSFFKSNLDDSSWHQARITRVSFDHAKMDRAQFDKAGGEAASFSRTIVTDANLVGVALNQASFVKSDFSRSDFTGSQLKGASFQGTELCLANFSRTSLEGAIFSECPMRQARYDGANLRGAVFRNCALIDVDFSSATLCGVAFQACTVANSQWREAEYDSKTLWPEGLDPLRIGAFGPKAVIVGKKFRGVRLTHADLTGMRMSNSAFSECILSHCDLSHSSISDCDLSRAVLNGIILFRATIHRVNFSGADLREANLKEASIVDSLFDGSAYSRGTKFPRHFNPEELNMILKDSL
jgi:uncharacterized protein YjbI with pentapeptide repeats